MSGYRSSETEMGAPAAKRFAKSSRSRSRATVIVRVSFRVSAKSSFDSHSLLNLTSVRAGSMILDACSKYVCAFRSISASSRIGRSAERPDGSPIRVV